MKKGVIFDLDLTLVASTLSEQARHIHDWQRVYALIHHYYLYRGMQDVFSYIRLHGIKTAIVSTAPRPYIQRVVSQFNIPANIIVGYHDAKPIKPHPATMLNAIEQLGIDVSDAISFGDRAIDMMSSIAAQIKCIACLWGTKEKSILLESPYDAIIYNPMEIIDILSSY